MMIRLLSIVWYKVLPARFGGQKGIAHFNEQLAKYASLTCLCSKNNEPDGPLSYKLLALLPETKRQFLLPSCHRLIKRIARQERPTHIILEHPYHGMAAVAAARATGAALVVHSHNIEFQRFRQAGKWWWKLLYFYERWVHRKATLSLFKTEEDKQDAIRHFNLAADKCFILPYGVERQNKSIHARESIMQAHGIDRQAKILLFAGTLDYPPNSEAVVNIFERIATEFSKRSLNYHIIICGRNRFPAYQYLRQLSHPLVTYAGEVNNIGDYFSAADVFINPVQTGSGIQTKNIDALSYDLNVVCFDAMLAGIDLAACANKIYPVLPNDWSAFVDTIIRCCNTPVTPTPAVFFAYYSFAAHVEKLAARLNSS